MYNKIWRTDSKITLVPLWSSKCMKVNPYTIWIFRVFYLFTHAFVETLSKALYNFPQLKWGLDYY